MFNSLLLAYRDRPEALNLFLKTLSNCQALKPCELIVVDLGSDTNTSEIIRPYRERIDIKHHQIDYRKTFWKTKALNYAIDQAEGEYVTVLDVDLLFPLDFLRSIEVHYDDPIDSDGNWLYPEGAPNTATKLAHPRFLLDLIATELVTRAFDHFYMGIVANSHRYEAVPNEHDGKLIGSASFTILRDTTITMGGFDERYAGYGYEDVEFNQRAYYDGIDTVLNTVPLFHLPHDRGSWANMDQKSPRRIEKPFNNRDLFEQSRLNDFPAPPVPSDWGVFEGSTALTAEQ